MARVVIFGSLPASLITFRGHLINELVEQGHEVIACAGGKADDVALKLANIGVNYHAVRMRRTGTSPLADLLLLASLVRLFRAIKPEIILGYTIKPVIYGSLAAYVAKVPRIFSMITGLGYAFSEADLRSRTIGRIVQVLYRSVLHTNERILFQNPDDRRLFLDKELIKEEQSFLINGSGVDVDEFFPDPFPKTVSFLLIARLIRDKGIVEYVEAAEALRRKYPEVRFRLVGMYDDNPTAISKEEVAGWVENGSIEFLGSMDDVRPALAECSVFVLPSFYREGIPRTLLEALAAGRPVITTNAPGCRETVDEGRNGYLVPLRDVESLILAMETFIKNPESIPEMGQRSRQIALEKYDVRKVTATILDALRLN